VLKCSLHKLQSTLHWYHIAASYVLYEQPAAVAAVVAAAAYRTHTMRKAPHISLLLLCTLLATCVASMAAGTRGLSRHLTQQEGSRKGEQGEQPAGFHPPKFDSDSVSTAQGGNVSLDR
jgi:hypothetical protein